MKLQAHTFRTTPDKTRKMKKYEVKHGVSIGAVTNKLWDVELLHEDFKDIPELKKMNIIKKNFKIK